MEVGLASRESMRARWVEPIARHRPGVRRLASVAFAGIALLVASHAVSGDSPASQKDSVAGATTGSALLPAGFGRAVITPEQPMWMAGYSSRDRPAEGVLTDLFVKAMALGEPPVVLVTLDLIGIDRDTSGRIMRRLEERYGLPRERVALNASHTHSGPLFGKTAPSLRAETATDIDVRNTYTSRLEDRILESVGAALADRRPAQVSWGRGTCSVAVNRRENKEVEVSAIRAAGRPLRGPVDHDVPVLAIHDPTDGAIRAAVFGYACHATVVGSYLWCGDYPGFACLEWERRHPDATAMFWSGCGGDQNPLPRKTVDLAQAYGSRLADAVDAVLDTGALTPLSGRVTAQAVEVSLELDEIPDRSAWERVLENGDRFEQLRARSMIARLDRDGHLENRYSAYPVQVWNLGESGPRWVFLGGEVVVDYAVRLKAEYGQHSTWVAGYSNDVMAYIPSRRVLREGGYEGARSMIYYDLPAPWAPSIENTILRTVRSLIDAHVPR
jgi:neutral ceramidase